MCFRLVMFLLTAVITAIPEAQALSLEEYLSEVRARNEGILASKTSSEAKKLRKDEGSLFFKPSFFLTGEYNDDHRPTLAPVFQGTQTIRHTLRAGLSENFRTGTRASLSYNYYKTQINGVDGSLVPNRKFFDISPQIEITQSLWRNWLGSEFEAVEKAQNAQVEAQRYLELFNYKQLITKAENAYWRLYVAQTSLKVQEQSLERAKRLRDWNAERVRNNLVDESDLIQSEANFQARAIDYQDTLTEINVALQEFNSIRQTEGEVNLEGTKGRDSSYILGVKIPEKMKLREDVKAAIAQQKAAQANSILGVERNRPTLELYGTYAPYGRDPMYSQATEQAWTGTRPLSIVGVRFTTPLDLGSLSDYRKSYKQDAVAADLAARRKIYEVDRQWEILVDQFENYKKRLKLTMKLVEVQDKKFQTERRRFQQGRTTTFQVTQFEQDLANTQLLKLRYEGELIVVYNQLKLFSGVDHEQ